MSVSDFAFPLSTAGAYGLTKRELIAAMAMQGICSHPDTWGQQLNGIAASACQMADALLAELAKEPQA